MATFPDFYCTLVVCPANLLLSWSHESDMHYLQTKITHFIHNPFFQLPTTESLVQTPAPHLGLVEKNVIYHTLHNIIQVSRIIDNKEGLP